MWILGSGGRGVTGGRSMTGGRVATRGADAAGVVGRTVAGIVKVGVDARICFVREVGGVRAIVG